MRTILVEEGNELHLFGPSLGGRDEAELLEAFQGLEGFSCYRVRNAKNETFNAAVFNQVETKEGATRTYDDRMRPAVTLLRLLGRVVEEERTEDRVGGLPDVKLQKPLNVAAAEDPDRLLCVNAETIAETLRLSKATPQSPPNGFVALPRGGEADPLRVFGPETFSITLAQAAELERSGRVITDAETFPPPFYTALAHFTTSHISYYSDRRTQPLSAIGTPERTAELRRLLDESFARSSQLREQLSKTKPLEPTPEASGDEVSSYEEWCYEMERLSRKLERVNLAVAQLPSSQALDVQHQRFVSEVRVQPERYGFRDSDHVESVLGQSLNELSSSVCQAQKGFFMVGGKGAVNQLCPRTLTPVTFLSAAGIDFCSDLSTAVEGGKYFTESPGWQRCTPLCRKFDKWKEGGQQRFFNRIRSLYTCIFRAAQVQEVTHPCVLPMGLGVFLENVPAACKNEVLSAYIKAQIHLLQEQDWGFKAYVMNAGAPPLVKLVAGFLREEEDRMRCPVVLHTRDVKFVAVSLAERGIKAAYLNPSDAIAVLQGLIGYFWETGKGSCYVGEEDFAATSTAILSRVNISNLHTDSERVLPA